MYHNQINRATGNHKTKLLFDVMQSYMKMDYKLIALVYFVLEDNCDYICL